MSLAINRRVHLGQDGDALRAAYGNDAPGDWIPGQYRVACETEGIIITPRTITVSGEASGRPGLMQLALKTPVAGAAAESIRFMETDFTMPRPDAREYYTGFGGAPRYVGVEVKLAMKEPTTEAQQFTYTCHYFTVRGDIIGRASSNVKVEMGATSAQPAVSWGNRTGTFWHTGTYFAECDADGAFLASGYFSVTRR